MIIFSSTKQFDKTFETLNQVDQNRIIEKLQYLKTHPDILTVMKKVHDLKPATHRLRIGNLRILLKMISENKNDTRILLLKVGHRRDIYS